MKLGATRPPRDNVNREKSRSSICWHHTVNGERKFFFSSGNPTYVHENTVQSSLSTKQLLFLNKLFLFSSSAAKKKVNFFYPLYTHFILDVITHECASVPDEGVERVGGYFV